MTNATATNEEIREQEYQEAYKALTADVKRAITRSIDHDEKVEVAIDESILDIWDALRIVCDCSDDYDTACENDGSEDVWGMVEGEDFRLNFYTY